MAFDFAVAGKWLAINNKLYGSNDKAFDKTWMIGKKIYRRFKRDKVISRNRKTFDFDIDYVILIQWYCSCNSLAWSSPYMFWWARLLVMEFQKSKTKVDTCLWIFVFLLEKTTFAWN